MEQTTVVIIVILVIVGLIVFSRCRLVCRGQEVFGAVGVACPTCCQPGETWTGTHCITDCPPDYVYEDGKCVSLGSS